MNVREMDEMISAARKAGVKLKVFENFVFYPPYRKVKELMDAGEIGKPHNRVTRTRTYRGENS